MSKINKEHWQTYIKNKKEYCLYVGSCRDNFKLRLKHHLIKSSSTYGLHLDAWWEYNMPTISIFVLEYGDKIESIYLNQIEDVLWDEYKPLFGKRGPR